MLTKIFTANVMQSHLKAFAVLFALPTPKLIVAAMAPVRTAMPSRNAYDIINEES